MSTMDNYKPWLDNTSGLKPHRNKHDGSFNNVLFSAELLIAKQELGKLNKFDAQLFRDHIMANDTDVGGYAPKDSHDNILGRIAGLITISDVPLLSLMEVSKLNAGKHPRDRILFRFFLTESIMSWLLLPLALLDIYRGIVTEGKTRPSWTNKKYFMFRLKHLFGFTKQVGEDKVIFGGIEQFFEHSGKVDRMIHVQNDGKILGLIRLNLLRNHRLLKPFVRFCKKKYIARYGHDFQSQIFANYYEEEDHPIREAFRRLDARGKTIIDC